MWYLSEDKIMAVKSTTKPEHKKVSFEEMNQKLAEKMEYYRANIQYITKIDKKTLKNIITIAKKIGAHKITIAIDRNGGMAVTMEGKKYRNPEWETWTMVYTWGKLNGETAKTTVAIEYMKIALDLMEDIQAIGIMTDENDRWRKTWGPLALGGTNKIVVIAPFESEEMINATIEAFKHVIGYIMAIKKYDYERAKEEIKNAEKIIEGVIG